MLKVHVKVVVFINLLKIPSKIGFKTKKRTILTCYTTKNLKTSDKTVGQKQIKNGFKALNWFVK